MITRATPAATRATREVPTRRRPSKIISFIKVPSKEQQTYTNSSTETYQAVKRAAAAAGHHTPIFSIVSLIDIYYYNIYSYTG